MEIWELLDVRVCDRSAGKNVKADGPELCTVRTSKGRETEIGSIPLKRTLRLWSPTMSKRVIEHSSRGAANKPIKMPIAGPPFSTGQMQRAKASI